MRTPIFVLALGASALSVGQAAAQTSSATPSPVVVVVNVPIPPGLSRDRVVGAMRQTVPQYEAMPGLTRKYFTLSDDGRFGGVYLWRSRAEAQAWFSDAWRKKSLATYGVAPEVTYYDAPIVIAGPATGTEPAR